MSRLAMPIAAVGAIALALAAARVASASNSMSSPTPLASGVAQQESTSGYSTEADEPNTQPPFTGQCGDVGA
jgi:hypothetical protein